MQLTVIRSPRANPFGVFGKQATLLGLSRSSRTLTTLRAQPPPQAGHD